MFTNRREISLAPEIPPRLIVVVDTEEEFDWKSEPDRLANRVASMDHIRRVQDIFDGYGIRPCYVVDYPIASQPRGYESLREFRAAGRCEIGAQLHPWVNPPAREVLNRSNMYPGNLPEELERQKLEILRDIIADNFDCVPVAYKAGRYGFGKHTAGILADLGFSIDLSVCPPMDFSPEGGPDYSGYDASPFWFGSSTRPILEIPCTGGFVGWAGGYSRSLFALAGAFRLLRGPGILARLRAVDRLMLSPEGYSSEEHIRLTRDLFARGIRTFTWSFHSPSVVPGNTSYVDTPADLQVFLDSFYRYFDFFFGELGGEASSPSLLREQLGEADG